MLFVIQVFVFESQFVAFFITPLPIFITIGNYNIRNLNTGQFFHLSTKVLAATTKEHKKLFELSNPY
jgi:hypothetical protein